MIVDQPLAPLAVLAFLGMALFTVIMGNGFAAFPVMTGGVGVPVLVGMFHANPASMAAIGMFSGYCGTLMTPMAANFNIVPAALLELPDKNGVIRAQWPTAVTILVINIFTINFQETFELQYFAFSRQFSVIGGDVDLRDGSFKFRICHLAGHGSFPDQFI